MQNCLKLKTELFELKIGYQFGLDSQSSSATTVLSPGGVGGSWGNILNSADLETVSGKSSDGRLSTGSGGLGHNTTLSSELDVNSVDANSLKFSADVDGGEHGGVRGRLFSVGLDLHASSDAGVGFTA